MDVNSPNKSAGAGGLVRLDRTGAVLVLAMVNPPVNAISARLRADLRAGLQLALADPAVLAVVIASDIAQFSAGADMSELGQSHPGATLSALCTLIEDFPKPVIAAMNGNAVGGGLELALAAHGRVADAGAQMGLPEVNLGILPGAGGTQRLPRLVGAGPALKIMLEPLPLSAGQALAIGLVDLVVAEGLRATSVAFAQEMAAALAGRAPPRTSDRTDGFRDPVAYRTDLTARRKQFANARLPAPLRIVDCVEAAQLLPLDQGLAYEAAAFADLVITPEAQALRHAFMVERRALVPPADLVGVALPALNRIALWGGGDRAADTIVQALGAGLMVTLVDPQRDVLMATLERIAARQQTAVTEGRLSGAARDADWARLTQSTDGAALAGADLILFGADAQAWALAPGAAAITLGPLVPRAAGTDVALIPAPAAGLAAELCAGPAAAIALRAQGLALGRRLGWKVIFSGPGGPIERRLRAAVSAAIAGLESAGLNRSVIATALASFGLGVSEATALPPAPPEADVVVSACLAALANQGARMITEGTARRPADVDAVAMFSGIIPRWQGGPMYLADKRGLLVLRADLRKRAVAAPQLYAPDPLIDRLIGEGLDFASLNRK